jgi:hypothetical protein
MGDLGKQQRLTRHREGLRRVVPGGTVGGALGGRGPHGQMRLMANQRRFRNGPPVRNGPQRDCIVKSRLNRRTLPMGANATRAGHRHLHQR